MIDLYVQGTETLTAADLEGIVGGESIPHWWWLYLYGVSESQSIVDGFRAGFRAG